MVKIPFNKPHMTGKELEYIAQAHASLHISGDGSFTKKCHAYLENILRCNKALLTHSATAALEMSAILVDTQPGDEIIMPSFTFSSTANAFVLRGAKPVFIDIRPDTLNLDETQVEALITGRTKAIVPVHYAGVGCEMDIILEIAGRFRIPVIEDNALGLFGKYKGKYLGSFGSLAAQSFHETKGFTCGEGGALLINDPQYVERAEYIREKGTDRNSFFRGEVDKYTWIDIGSSYLPSDILAAFLYAQLESRDEILQNNRRIWRYYQKNLQGWAEENNICLPFVPEYCENPHNMFYLLVPDLEYRCAMIEHLHGYGINSIFHYLPLHLSTMGRKLGGKEGGCPRTEEISDRLLRLPFYNALSENDQKYIIEKLKGFKR